MSRSVKKSLFFLLCFYFLFHFLFLTKLPIFNDEAIYLDWAISAFRVPGHAFDSLLDAKQPLLIWIFGLAQFIFSEPLVAGRVVSVCTGALTLLGLFFLTQTLFDKKTAILASLFYCFTPIIVFYNRQALMESAVSCVGVWTIFLLIKYLSHPSKKLAASVGGVLGIGFLLKSSVILFLIPTVGILVFSFVKKPSVTKAKEFGLFLLCFFSFAYIVLVQPLFWETLGTNQRYAFTVAELFSLPFYAWGKNLWGVVEIAGVFMTPLLFIASVIGGCLLFKQKSRGAHVFLFYTLSALSFEVLLGKTQSQRYLLPVVPLLIVPAAFFLRRLWLGAFWKKGLVMFSGVIPFFCAVFLVINPYEYVHQASRVSKYAETAHIYGQTSGYGIAEAVAYIKEKSAGDRTSVFFAMNAGNPESAIDVYTQKSPNLYGLYFDAQVFSGLEAYDCAMFSIPAYFVSRGEEQAGMEKFLTLEKKFFTPDGKYFVGVYTLKTCEENVLSLDRIYDPVIKKMQENK